MKRPEVGHLHEALAFLGFPIGEAEKTKRRFGASTVAAVVHLQKEQKLLATREIDEATAKRYQPPPR
jgi:hypothetical protein